MYICKYIWKRYALIVVEKCTQLIQCELQLTSAHHESILLCKSMDLSSSMPWIYGGTYDNFGSSSLSTIVLLRSQLRAMA